MSGGTYNYFFLKLNEFINEVKEENQKECHSESDLTLRNKLLDILETLEPTLKAIEWTDSGDSSLEDEQEKIKEAFNKIKEYLNN